MAGGVLRGSHCTIHPAPAMQHLIKLWGAQPHLPTQQRAFQGCGRSPAQAVLPDNDHGGSHSCPYLKLVTGIAPSVPQSPHWQGSIGTESWGAGSSRSRMQQKGWAGRRAAALGLTGSLPLFSLSPCKTNPSPGPSRVPRDIPAAPGRQG